MQTIHEANQKGELTDNGLVALLWLVTLWHIESAITDKEAASQIFEAIHRSRKPKTGLA